MAGEGKQIWAEWDSDGMDNWRNRWQDVAELEHPIESWITTEKTEGDELRNTLMDPIGEEALGVFTDGFVGSAMPKTEQWAEFEPVSQKDEKGRETQPTGQTKKAWRVVSDRFSRLLAESNFYEAIHESVKDGGAFGNGCPGVFQGKESRLTFLNSAPGQFGYDEDEEGRPHTIRRIFKWTAHQLKIAFDRKEKIRAGKYANGGLPERVLKRLEAENQTRNEKFEVIERIRPNPKPRKLPGSGVQPFASRAFIGEYAIKGEEDVIFTEGYYEKPWAPWRLEKGSQEKYGRGLGMKSLPLLRMVQKMYKEYIIALEKANDTGWLVHADSDFKEDGRAGGVNFWDGDVNMKPERLEPNFGFNNLEEEIEKVRNRVRTIHFNDIFKLFLRDDIANKELKAAQVDAMMDEKLPLLVGIANRFLNECLTPLLRRTFMILLRGGAFDDLREQLGAVNLFRISFKSRIAMAVKTLESRGILQVLNAIAIVDQYDQEAKLKIDIKEMLGRLAENSTAPSEYVRTEEEAKVEVEALREQQAAITAAQVAKDVGAANKGFQ